MGRILVDVADELEMKFRELVLKKFGAKKGALKMAVEEALKLWIEKESKIPAKEEER